MRPNSRSRSIAVLALILGVGIDLAAQDIDTLVGAVDRNSDLTVSSDLITYEDERLAGVFGDDLEAVLDYGALGVFEFDVTDGTNRSEVRVYEMIDSAAAFGWFAHKRD